MKQILFLFFILSIMFINHIKAQTVSDESIPKVEIKNGVTYWYGISITDAVNKADLIFEGRILTDTPFFKNSPGDIFSRHQVIVLKQFKGNFTSDTITVITRGGRMMLNGHFERSPRDYGFKDEEAVIFATNSQKIELGGNDPNAYWPFYGPEVSYVKICNKKDVVKEVYEPIEAVTGQPYIDVRPNNCATQKQK